MSYVWLLLGLGLIFLAAEVFTNAIEWFGKRLSISEGAVGSVLAAVGTALPETSVAVVAIVKGGEHAHEVGVGAILGAPMMLSTLAMFMTGMAVLVFAGMGLRTTQISANYKVVGRDLRSFVLVYMLALIAGLIGFRTGKLAIAIVLIFIYAAYVYKTFAHGAEADDDEMRPLHICPNAEVPRLRWVLVQLLSGVALMLFGADILVENVKIVAEHIGISALVLSVIIVPIATELPEKFNSITWMRHKKDTLALGNVTGAMVFQSSLLPAIGIIATPWHLEPRAAAAIVVALVASFLFSVEMLIRKRLSPYVLLAGGLLYALYPIFVFWVLPNMEAR